MARFTKVGSKKINEIAIQARRARGLTLREFAKLTTISPATICRLEDPEDFTDHEDDTLEKLAPYTPFSLEQLIIIAAQLEENLAIKTDYTTSSEIMPIIAQLAEDEEVDQIVIKIYQFPDMTTERLYRLIHEAFKRVEQLRAKQPNDI